MWYHISMTASALKKAAVYLLPCGVIWLLLYLFASNPIYAAWSAALMGVCCLLAAWVQHQRARGQDVFAAFRKKNREVPYYLRGDAAKRPKTRLGINGNRHAFDDDLKTAADPAGADVPARRQHNSSALAFLIIGVLLLVWSQLQPSLF